MNGNNKQQNPIRSQTKESSVIVLSLLIRILLFFIPITILGPLFLYTLLYWWFVPISMRLDVPLSFPSTGLKIVGSLCVIPVLILSKFTSEALASSLPERLVNSLHRIIAPASFLISLLSGFAAMYLFSPLIGLPALSPPIVALIFGSFVLFGWLNILKKGLGIFANIDSRNRHPQTIVGPSAPELLASDKRPPILYLRSFKNERSRATTLGRFSYIQSKPGGFYFMARRPRASDSFSALLRKSLFLEYKRKLLDSNRSAYDEQMIFSEYFSEFGPYVAIGMPGETFESMDLGASKIYVPDEAWKTEVVDLINSSGAIIIEATKSEGLSWEIGQIIGRVSPEKVLLILPRNDAEYHGFCTFAAGLFPHSMPKEMPCTRLIMFGADWSPIPLNNATIFLEDAVQPFVDRLGLGTSSDKKQNNSADAKSRA